MADFPNNQGNAAGAIPAWVTDPVNGYYIKPNADGSINISGIAAATLIQSLAFATADIPAYTEGTDQKLSQTLDGELRVQHYSQTSGEVLFAKISNGAASGDVTLVAGVGGKKIRVLGYALTSNGNVDVKFQSAATTDLTGPLYCGAHSGAPSQSFNPMGVFETVAGEDLTLNSSANQGVGGHLTYVLV